MKNKKDDTEMEAQGPHRPGGGAEGEASESEKQSEASKGPTGVAGRGPRLRNTSWNRLRI